MSDDAPVARLGHAKLYPIAVAGKPVIIVVDRQKKRKRRKRGKR